MTNDNTQGQIAGYRLSPQQEALWLQRPEQASYRVQCAMLLPRNAAPEELRAALESVVSRHEALRTTFAHQPGLRLPVQVVHDELAPAWSVESPDGSIEERESVEALLASEAQTPRWRGGAGSRPGRRPGARADSARCFDTASLGVVVRGGGARCSPVPTSWESRSSTRASRVVERASRTTTTSANAARVLVGARASHASSPSCSSAHRASPMTTTPAHVGIALEPGTMGGPRSRSVTTDRPPVVVEAAWHALVSRLSGRSEIASFPRACRRGRE